MDNFVQMFGLSKTEMKEMYGVKWVGSQLVASGSDFGASVEFFATCILSDVQEAYAHGDAELARQLVNRSKFLLQEAEHARRSVVR